MAKNANDVVITHFARTAFDKFGGPTRTMHTVDLLEAVLKELINRSGLRKDQVDEIINGSGVVLEIGQRVDIPVRQALLQAGFPYSTVSNHIDRACCSSTSALQQAWKNMMLGENEIAFVTGGDNIGNAPMIVDPKYRTQPLAIGNFTMRDPLFNMGYAGFGVLAVDTGEIALENGVTKEMQDEWAYGSHVKWGKAFDRGYFKDEIFPLEIMLAKNKPPVIFDKDASPRPDTSLEQIAKLPLVNGSATVSAGNAPGINAGASGLVVMTRKKAEELGFTPLAKVHKVANIAEEANKIAVAPAPAIKKALDLNGLKLEDIELIEINEAFAAMPLVSTKILANGDAGKWDYLKSITNVNGGAVAIGHPIGGTGTRLCMTLIRELKARGGKYGVVAICGGLGQGDAVILEVE